MTPIAKNIIDDAITAMGIKDFGKATIREIVAIAQTAEKASGQEFVKMEMGVPGLQPSKFGVEAQVKALQDGIARLYPNINGLPELKNEASRFVKAFIDVDINPEGCVPVCGSMQGTYASFMTVAQSDPKKNTILFIDPGFPVQKQQCVVMGANYETFDVYHFRGDKLGDKLESYLATGRIAAIVYSNPNNPAWICLTEEELRTIGTLATKYDAIVLEDLAYFAMDFRKDLSTPFQPPFQPTVARYTDNYVLLISGSKAFSYAGERIGVTCISNALYHRAYPALTEKYGNGEFGSVRADIMEYGRRAHRLKEIFLRHGFSIVYDKDQDEPIADGFYFTITYPGFTGKELARELLYYGVSAIALDSTGSQMQGLRVCTSFIQNHQYDILDQRMALFQANHS